MKKALYKSNTLPFFYIYYGCLIGSSFGWIAFLMPRGAVGSIPIRLGLSFFFLGFSYTCHDPARATEMTGAPGVILG